ncbi:MAG TPA: response regulator [Azospirillum sp.]|nr:response regulator [Azospirillum sp.]
MDLVSDLRRFRKENDLSQQELATFLGVSQRTVSRWEQGIDRPTDEARARLRLLIGDADASPWPAVYDSIREAVVPMALVDGNGTVLVASKSYPGAPGRSAGQDQAVPVVLVIDDDEAVLKATRAALKRWQFLSLGAADGESAVAMVTEERVRPDAAVIDFLLPGVLDGVDTAKALRAALPGLPVLLITGEATPERMRKIVESGFPLIPKPVDPQRIKLALTSMLARRRDGGAPAAAGEAAP